MMLNLIYVRTVRYLRFSFLRRLQMDWELAINKNKVDVRKMCYICGDAYFN